MVGFGVLQQQINLIRRFFSNVQTPDSVITRLSEMNTLMPGATWTAAGIGRHQLTVARWSLELGGHVRTGLEDNLKYDRTRLAKSNAELVAQVVDACPEFDRHPASVDEARNVLGL